MTQFSAFFFKFYVIISFFIISFGLVKDLWAQEDQKQPSYEGLFFKREGRFAFSIKFELINNLILVPIRINDASESSYFIINSGLRDAVISEIFPDQVLQFNRAEKVKISGLGQGEGLWAYTTQANLIQMGENNDLESQTQPFLVLLDDAFQLSSRFGKKIQGIMGYDFFKNFIIKIDYHTKLLTFYHPEKYTPKIKRKTQVFDLELQNKKPYIKLDYFLYDSLSKQKVKRPIKVLVDTGGSHALWLDAYYNDLIKLPAETAPTYIGKGFNGDIFGAVGKIEGLGVGKQAFTSLLTTFPDSLSLNAAPQKDGRQGSIGGEILRRFEVIIDYPNQKLYLKPNRYLKDPIYYNRAGLEIVAPMPDFPYFLVGQVERDSPADLAGLKAQDQLVSINGTPVSEYSLGEIQLFFRKRAGTKIWVSFRREGQTEVQRVRLVLRSPIE
ncbi:PDZ domain-containing protein [Hugenholtzia roseola]|uniref:PDZ domain-containing protein n=1 Tax=Hugenholtzia roseola TaxID=1002 RepID=UPI00047969F4|nr:PDZ domain-containing protein [Hugenholtzia roseola]